MTIILLNKRAAPFLLIVIIEFVMPHFQVGLRSITSEGREQGKRFGVEQYEMRTFSRDRHILENLVSLSLSLSLSHTHTHSYAHIHTKEAPVLKYVHK